MIGGLVISLCAAAVSADAVDFPHDVVPILRTHCVECHGGEHAEGGFQLNTRDLFLESGVAEPGAAEDSHFLDLVRSRDADVQMPPPEKPRLTDADVAVLSRWVDAGMPWEAGFTFGLDSYEPPLRPRRPALPAAGPLGRHPIDRLVAAYINEHGLEAAGRADDATFLRRVSLDLTGLLPTAEQARRFLGDDAPDKRARLIDELLADDAAYAEHWLTFWNDLLRNDYDGTGFITKGRTQVSGWLYRSLRENKPFDDMLRELIAPPSEESAGFINGIKWRGTVSAGQTIPIQFSQSVSQAFLGINMKCASCHDSFVDRWKLADAYGLAAVYAEGPLELHRCDKPTGRTAVAAWPFPELGTIEPDAAKEERLNQLAALMTHPENGRVPRTIVNRLWARLMGRGIVHPLDAMQTRPFDADLLDWLAADFQDHGYDLKRTLRLIATSNAYQAAAAPIAGESDAAVPGPRAKRLTAEQFVDAVWRLSGGAPDRPDAPVDRGPIEEADASEYEIASRWVWRDSGWPPPGTDRVLLRRTFRAEDGLRSATLAAAADNRLTVWLNGDEILRSDDWTSPQLADVLDRLRPENELLILAGNGGEKPNPAGAFCCLRLVRPDGSVDVLQTGADWQAAEVTEGEGPPDWDLEGVDWRPATVVSLPFWNETVDPKLARRFAESATKRPVRASLMKADSLMRTLGRPNRDQIVTSRPNELTTLEAVTLSTSADLMGDLRSAAERLAGRPTGELVSDIYHATLSRPPTMSERELAVAALGKSPDADGVSDLLWAILMSPEFLLIR